MQAEMPATEHTNSSMQPPNTLYFCRRSGRRCDWSYCHSVSLQVAEFNSIVKTYYGMFPRSGYLNSCRAKTHVLRILSQVLRLESEHILRSHRKFVEQAYKTNSIVKNYPQFSNQHISDMVRLSEIHARICEMPLVNNIYDSRRRVMSGLRSRAVIRCVVRCLSGGQPGASSRYTNIAIAVCNDLIDKRLLRVVIPEGAK